MGAKPTTSEPELRSDRDPLLGSVLNGKYKVIGVLARGGMGKIYRAEQAPLGRPVALKVLRTKYADDEGDDAQFQKRFLLEASILAKLQHPNIVTLYDYGRIESLPGEQYFMAMEFLAGDTLARRLKRGPLDPRDALRTMRQVARGLREAHRQGAVHRDLKPSNIMLVPEEDGGEVVKILDFGIGKIVGGAVDDLTAEGAFLGSPRYMAPEQISEGKVDTRTDVYALGVMMYECLTGKLPFEGDTNINIMMAHCNQPVPPMGARAPNVAVPECAESLARACLEKDAAMRPQGMDVVMRALAACEEQLYGVGLGSSGAYGARASGGYDSAPSSPGANPTITGSFAKDPVTGAITGAVVASPRAFEVARQSSPPTGTHRSLTRSQFPGAAPDTERRRRGVFVWIGAAALLLGAAVVVVLLLGRGGSEPAAAAAPPAPSAAATPTPRLVAVATAPPEPTKAQPSEPIEAAPTATLSAPSAPPQPSVSALVSAAPDRTERPPGRIPARVLPPPQSRPTATQVTTAPEPDIKLKR